MCSPFAQASTRADASSAISLIFPEGRWDLVQGKLTVTGSPTVTTPTTDSRKGPRKPRTHDKQVSPGSAKLPRMGVVLSVGAALESQLRDPEEQPEFSVLRQLDLLG